MSERPVRIKVRDVELATREEDRKPRLRTEPLFLWGHGLMGSMAQEDAVPIFDWSPVYRHARLVRYDARSHGESDLDLDPAHLRWPELARDMLALADALGAERALLGGVSMGCATSLHAAILARERVIGLVLVAPPTAWQTRPRQARFYRIAALQAGVIEQFARSDARAVATAMRGAADSDLPDHAALRGLHVPTLVLAWRGDPTHPVSTATQLADLLPRAELHVATTLDEVRAWPDLIAAFAARARSERRP